MTTAVATCGDVTGQGEVALRTRESWMRTYPGIPIYVHDVWLDVVVRRGMQKWRVVTVSTSSTQTCFVLVGILSLQALTARAPLSRREGDANSNDLDYNSSTWMAVHCLADLSPFDMREVALLRSQLAQMTGPSPPPPPRNLVLAMTTQSPPSISYYTMQDCLAV
ncbi:hypothetical protein H310_10990 [Aphanomyces invadans]|uniref:Uncharacterized protein n=1 Tax=Aphanomyces invadans TaxID=157072 RepID=A0A024TPI6_9STRA|nr:hypothetical protein H310_10990 [Aphanomyces invadans]ETV95546.1 hypothetical protein H310_10990 [Aphanomyces invadans]|eukprot:XP_008875739.1 hypothetical protein H310_10990 [Aphanomyces invadans]